MYDEENFEESDNLPVENHLQSHRLCLKIITNFIFEDLTTCFKNSFDLLEVLYYTMLGVDVFISNVFARVWAIRTYHSALALQYCQKRKDCVETQLRK